MHTMYQIIASAEAKADGSEEWNLYLYSPERDSGEVLGTFPSVGAAAVFALMRQRGPVSIELL